MLQKIMDAAQKLGLSTISLNSAVARSLEIHPTDAWILTYMQDLPPDAPLTPGDLARITGLTTGAITGVIDRLEAHGYVRRERDPVDRRKVILVPTQESVKVANAFQPLVEGCMDLCLKYSPNELNALLTYLEGSVAVAEETIGRLRQI
ncbi:MarR family winged helix-turn-helix transcriptional regulator [Streptomyces litchfieldiae]|uniref:MarR family transcriptional regulator n=1 Tax=Streptomyces litchfieldiae TaxID=3075543 RepID=A0ABU2MZ74_9ACTN|nr:MarR family transcriptional regulator [Streptomyces sp. DSM 44938]MDT0345819.1 MarR family transcriptional regulator [Streptomyces sp. DSM 44938]